MKNLLRKLSKGWMHVASYLVPDALLYTDDEATR